MNDNYKNREEKLLDQLNHSPIEEITGTIGASSPSGHGSDQPDIYWMIFSLAAWKRQGGDLKKCELVIRQPGVIYEQLKTHRSTLRPYSLVKLRVRLAEDSIYGRPEALLLEILDRKFDDPELDEFAKALQVPQIFTDTKFGEFVLDREINWYEGNTNWCGILVNLNLEVTGKKQPEEVVEVAHQLWRDQPGWHARVLDCAVKELLETANEWWSDHNEGTLSADDFKSKMTLESITVHPDGGFEFWFDDGDLFWGHSISVRGSLAEGPTDASIAG